MGAASLSELVVDRGRWLVGDVSASDRFYNVIQYGDVVESVALALEAEKQGQYLTKHAS